MHAQQRHHLSSKTAKLKESKSLSQLARPISTSSSSGNPPASLPSLPEVVSYNRTKSIPNIQSTSAHQCIGTTKQGRRCLNKSCKDSQYCHRHMDQDQRLLSMLNSLSVTTRSISPGYIYVYTFESGHNNVHVYDHEKQAYIRLPMSDQMTSSTSTSKRPAKTGLFTKIFQQSKRPNSYDRSPRAMLVKVGQTSKTPVKRLSEWKQKCQHPIVLLSPPLETRSSTSFDYSEHGWPTNQARPTEAAIHNELRALFGKGHVECRGCKERGRHNEWFLVPADKISTLYDTIHYWVQLYKNDQPE